VLGVCGGVKIGTTVGQVLLTEYLKQYFGPKWKASLSLQHGAPDRVFETGSWLTPRFSRKVRCVSQAGPATKFRHPVFGRSTAGQALRGTRDTPPIAAQVMIVVPWLQKLVVCQSRQNGRQIGVQCGPVLALGLPFVVAFDGRRALNRPHEDRPSALQRWQSACPFRPQVPPLPCGWRRWAPSPRRAGGAHLQPEA